MSTNITFNITLMDGVTAIFLLVVGGSGALKLAMAAIRQNLRLSAEPDVESIATEISGAGDSATLNDPSVGDTLGADV